MNKVRMVIVIDEQLRRIIKYRALDNGLTLRDWVLSAIATKIKEEDDLEEKDE